MLGPMLSHQTPMPFIEQNQLIGKIQVRQAPSWHLQDMIDAVAIENASFRQAAFVQAVTILCDDARMNALSHCGRTELASGH